MNWCFNFILQFEVQKKKIYYQQLLKAFLEKNIYIMFCKDPRVPTFLSLFVTRNMPKVSLLNLIASWKQ